MNVTTTYIKNTLPVGIYAPTSVDAKKAAAEFLVTSVCGGYYIKVQSDKIDVTKFKPCGCDYKVTATQLNNLKAKFNWATDF